MPEKPRIEIERGHLLLAILRARIVATRSKTELEDLDLPYKPKRRTKATIARERGLEPLADLVWAQAIRLEKSRAALARPFVDAAKGVPDVYDDLKGALTFLRSVGQADQKRLAVFGFCRGGVHALMAARAHEEIRVIVVFHGFALRPANSQVPG